MPPLPNSSYLIDLYNTLNKAKVFIGHDLIRDPLAPNAWICTPDCLKCKITALLEKPANLPSIPSSPPISPEESK